MSGDGMEFICDSMLGGLARWLRAAGYDAEFHYGIADRELVSLALTSGKTLLSSDGPMFERNVIRNGQVRALFIPRQLGKHEQLRFVLRELNLPLLPPRCMACGGELLEVAKHLIIEEAPPLAYRRCQQFWRCSRCGRLLWHGTHWRRICRRLADIGPPKDTGPNEMPRGDLISP